MAAMARNDLIIRQDDRILITGATGFIGSRFVVNLLDRGFRNIRCFVRPSSGSTRRYSFLSSRGVGTVEVITGNLLSREDCKGATKDVTVIFHLAAGRGENPFLMPL